MNLELTQIDAEEMEVVSGKIVGARAMINEAHFLCEKGMTFVACQNSEPFLLIGIFPLWAGVAEGWVLHRAGLKAVPVFTLRCFRKIVKWAFERMNLHRLQIDFDLSIHANAGMPEAAGFKAEGLMRRFTYDGQDRLRMAIVRETPCR